MMKQVVFTFTLLLFVLDLKYVESQFSEGDFLVYQDPSSCDINQNETFSKTSLGCVKCHWENGKGGFIRCPCTRENYDKTCFSCNSKNNSLLDANLCLPCNPEIPLNVSTGLCSSCPSNSIKVSREVNGSLMKEIVCIKCAQNHISNSEQSACIKCHPSLGENCQCPGTHTFINGVCFPPSDSPVGVIDERAIVHIQYDTINIESIYFKENLYLAFLLCKNGDNGDADETACQILANLCTILLHTFDNGHNACYLYRLAVSGPANHPPPHLPKLYFGDVEAPATLARTSSIPLTFDMDLSRSSSDVNITLARYSIDGKFLGLALLVDLIPCLEETVARRASQKFGTTYKRNCELPISEMWKKYGERMEFFDPYLSYWDHAKGMLSLYPIPIRIINYKKNSQRVNVNEDKYQWQLVRRFFFLDSVGGFDGSEGLRKNELNTMRVPKVVRVLSNVHLGVQLQNSGDAGRIYVPLLTLIYTEIDSKSFLANELLDFQFNVEYHMDMSRALEDVKIAVGVISAFAIVWSFIQTWGHNRRNGRIEMDASTLSQLVFISCGHLADAFFIVSFSSSLFWLFFFKKQVAVHVFLPQRSQERLIRDLIISTFALKMISVIKMILRQVDIDIFFIDWERPKARSIIQPPTEKQSDKEEGRREKEIHPGVSIWRTYFIANEWNEIQAVRKIHFASHIIIVLFFLEVLGFKWWGLQWSNGNLSPEESGRHVPFSTSARFAVGAGFFGILGFCQWVYKVGLYERFISNKIQDFVDVCTMANVSVFILSALQQGYYIHGRSVHGFADTDMLTMIEQLHREEEDLCGRRGLVPSTDQQTFLITVPQKFRTVYNQVLHPLYAGSNVGSVIAKGRKMSDAKGVNIGSNKATEKMLQLSVNAYHSMNRFLTAFLEHALSDLDYDIGDKSFFETTLDMEFKDGSNERSTFFNDNGHSFDSILFYGNERILFLFELYVFVFVDIFAHNFLLAGIVSFTVNQILKQVRTYLGKKNLARKTLIDGRFLI